MEKRCAIYCRFSSDLQDVSSLADQERVSRRYAEANGWNVVEVYSDAAISGTHNDRPGFQRMMDDARARQFDILVAEDLDRLNRRLEHTAALYNQLQFVGIEIHTVSRGRIDDIQVGIGGLMGELYVKNLAQKTRRGLEGRVRAGKSGGGNAYGYDVVAGTDATGNPITGEREINPREAEIVREIFRRAAAGEGPRRIASDLNARGVPGPRGRGWSDTTIRGHAKRGTGILNNTLYIGKLSWGRQSYPKNPSSGRRNARINNPDTIVVTDVPDLRIIDDELWAAVKEQQARVSRPTTDPFSTNPLNDAHRPKFLLSGLLTCGVCGGAYTIRAKDRYGCAARGNKGSCSNSRTITRQDLELRVLDGLKGHLVTPDLVEEFAEAYTAEWNRLQSSRTVSERQREKELAVVNRRIKAMVDAIEQGIITETTKERLIALEADRARLTAAQKELPAPMPALHPNLAKAYREKVARLEVELDDPEITAEAKSVLRSLIEKIIVFPGEKRGEVHLELHGELAAILGMTIDQKNKQGPNGTAVQVSVEGGEVLETPTFRVRA